MASADAELQEVCSAVMTVCKETSPDSKCPICLDRFNNVAYADRCFHRFCFCCILEWGKNKAECPLCKQPFGAIYHSVRSEVDFRLHKLAPVKNGSFGEVRGQRFRYRTTLTGQRRREGGTRRDSRPQEVARFRCWLYRHDVRVRCVRDDGRSREASAEFFRKNPACLHRLVPWLKRELAVLCGSHDSSTDVVLHLILSLLTRYDMQDEAFLHKLRPFLLTQTEHFLHEFLSFAKSPFNMDVYDRHAVYDCPAPSRLSAVSEDDVDLSSTPFPWDDETPGPSYSSAMQHVYTVTDTDSDGDGTSEEEEETVSVQANANVNDSYAAVGEEDFSSDEDCIIVGFIKPAAERTPELVQLSSDSDVSVQEPSTSNQSEPRDPTNQRHQSADHLLFYSDTKHESVRSCRNWERNWSRESPRRHSLSLSYKEINHSSVSHTPQHRHRRYTHTQPSHTHSPSKTYSHSSSRTHARSRSRTHARSRSRTHTRSCSRTHTRSRSRTHTRSRSRTHTRSRSRTHARSRSRTHARSRSRTHARSRSRTRARSRSRTRARSRSRTRARSRSRIRCKEKHHHHNKKKKKKKKKKRRRRSSSIEVSAERRKKKKHKTTRRNRNKQTGWSSKTTSPAVITIITDSEETPTRGAATTNTEELTQPNTHIQDRKHS